MAFNFLLCLQKKHSKSGKKIKTMLEKRGEHRFAGTLQTAPLSIRMVSLVGRGAISIKTVYFGGRGVIFWAEPCRSRCWEADALLCLLALPVPGAATWVPLAQGGDCGAEPERYSHCPVVPVHEDEEHGSQEEQDGQHDDGHLGETKG